MQTLPEERLTVDIEDKLKDDADGEFKTALHADLAEEIGAIDRLLNQGVAPDEFSRLNTIKQGLQAADIVLEKLWLHHHHQG